MVKLLEQAALEKDTIAEGEPSPQKGCAEPHLVVSGGSIAKRRAAKDLRVRSRMELLDGDANSRKRKMNEISPGDDTVNVGRDIVDSVVAASNVVVGKSAYAKVKDTLRLFNKHYLHFVQEEEKRCCKEKHDKDSKDSIKKGESNDEKIKTKVMRPDLEAITKIKETSTILYSKKQIGHIPGIDVGHQFFSRAEMVVVGFHSHWLNGIDYMGQAYNKGDKKHKFPIAVAIVLSGIYEDDHDNADNVVYTGQGGNDLLGSKRQIGDQFKRSVVIWH